MLKTGTVHIQVIGINCPTCDEPIDGPRTGSFMITSDTELHSRDVVFCHACKNSFRLPKHDLLRSVR